MKVFFGEKIYTLENEWLEPENHLFEKENHLNQTSIVLGSMLICSLKQIHGNLTLTLEIHGICWKLSSVAVLSVPMVVDGSSRNQTSKASLLLNVRYLRTLINSRNIQQIEFSQVLQNEALHRRLSRWHVAGIHPSRRERRDVHPCSSVWRFSKPRTPQNLTVMYLVNHGKSASATLPTQQESTLLSHVPTHTYAECKI